MNSIENNNPSSTSARERRHALNKAMHELSRSGISCQSCSGVCCTFTSNSMQLTPLEALDIVDYLREIFPAEVLLQIKQVLQENISKFRLDKLLSLGAGRALRKNYTCPFFNLAIPHPQHGIKKGCFLSRHNKPYGCLAFNPVVANQVAGGNCRSDADGLRLLEVLQVSNSNNVKQRHKHLNLSWQKETIPMAVLDILNKTE